jgi:hypothetical protein
MGRRSREMDKRWTTLTERVGGSPQVLMGGYPFRIVHNVDDPRGVDRVVCSSKQAYLRRNAVPDCPEACCSVARTPINGPCSVHLTCEHTTALSCGVQEGPTGTWL